MEKNDKAPFVDNPQLADKIFAYIQLGLVANLPWLDMAFGRAQKLVKKVGDRNFFYPSVYRGARGNDYVQVSPDSKIGNFSFFRLDDPQDFDWIPNQQSIYVSNFSLIFWFDFRKMPSGAAQRNTEEVKTQILQLLNGGIWLQDGNIKIKRIYEEAENIYRGYSLDEVDNQFLMHPFAGFRFEGELRIMQPCF